MALLSEYAVTPDVFNLGCYKSRDLGKTHIGQLQQVFLTEGLVRDLRNGAWHKLLKNDCDKWVKEVLKNLKKNGRLVPSNPALSHTPLSDREWCAEALESHKPTPLNGIIVSDATERTYRGNQLVESVNKISDPNKAKWWSPIDSSLRLNRTIKDYKDALELIFRHANSIMFIDPYIYPPPQSNYADFIKLLEAAGDRPPQSPRPLVEIEIHSKIREIRKKNGELENKEATHRIMENTFRDKFGPVLSQSNLKVEVFIWDNFHDRYLISNLGGVLVPHGFDTSTSSALTTWSRLGRSDRDDVQREFARESNKHKLHFNFIIP